MDAVDRKPKGKTIKTHNMKNLVIVESPAKAKTIEKFLGKDYTVKSSYGHIRDLSKKEMSIDVDNNYEPEYHISDDKHKLVSELKKAVSEADQVWLASDEDREGEAIAWHLHETLNLKDENTKRIVFNEITKSAILHAIENPRKIDMNLVDAQQARRVLDRLVGYEISPILWSKIKPALSAGRVQSVAVRLIVEREEEIKTFNSESYFKLTAQFATGEGKRLSSEVSRRIQGENEAARLLEAVGVSVAYLTGNIKTKGRDNLLSALKKGDINLVIGTHALFSKNVQYHDLALAIIDEQHRFGVMQRSAILDKGRTSVVATDKFAQPPFREPNLLMMSATPIPQTLALTVFGDLDVRTIHTMPQGRKPVTTYLTKAGNERNAYEAVRKELNAGHQAYFVYPAIEQNLDANEGEFGTDSFGKKSPLKSAEESFTFLQTQVYPNFKCALIHSKIEEEEQNRILEDFRANKIQVLVATTVVEVGVDVPNATCMVIEQADRFGLAALHQLRGRVGRGSAQSYCFLIYRANITENGIERMKALHETTDGFKIAEEDLRLRGPGEITGTAQSGELAFKIANLARDMKLMQEARHEAFAITENAARMRQKDS